MAITIKLSTASVDNAINELKALKDLIKYASRDTTKEIIEEGVATAKSYDVGAPDTGNDKYDFVADYKSDSTKGSIIMEGQDAVFVEFGTGDIGEENSHPLETSTPGIVGYNKFGTTIRENEDGKHYWFAPVKFQNAYYKKGGYTRGIPAGLQMYNTLSDLYTIAPKIARKHISQAIYQYTKR